MSDAVIGFLGVIVGAVVAGGVSLLGEQFTTKREREARQALREQERRDRRDTFQRDTILALQDGVAEFWPLVMGTRLEPGTPPSPIRNAEVRALHWRINMLRARIFDDELREVVRKLQGEIHRVASEADLDAMEGHAKAADRLTSQMYNRMNTLLKELF